MPNSGNRQSTNGNEPSDGLYKFLEYELGFQRTRKQEIFSWASSLLVAIIGGVIALTVVHGAMLAERQKWEVTAAILILCLFSCPWMGLHWAEYCRVRDKLSFYYNQIPASGKDDYWRYDFTSIAAIVALSAVALFSVWCTIPSGSHAQSDTVRLVPIPRSAYASGEPLRVPGTVIGTVCPTSAQSSRSPSPIPSEPTVTEFGCFALTRE